MFNGKKFGEKIKEVSNGKTQKEIAELLNISPSSVNQWINGNKTPTIEHLLTLSETFNCSIDYLLGRSDDIINLDIRDIIRQLFIYDYYNKKRNQEELDEKGEYKEYYGTTYFNVIGLLFSENQILIKDEENTIKKLFKKYDDNKLAINSLPSDFAIKLIDELIKTHKDRYPIPEWTYNTKHSKSNN